MTQHGGLSMDELWQRVGLDQLRQTVRRTEEAIRRFEQVLGTLPACNTCARSALLETLHRTSRQLGRETVGLQVLAASLKQGAEAAEREHDTLKECPPAPCHCAGEPCHCHS